MSQNSRKQSSTKKGDKDKGTLKIYFNSIYDLALQNLEQNIQYTLEKRILDPITKQIVQKVVLKLEEKNENCIEENVDCNKQLPDFKVIKKGEPEIKEGKLVVEYINKMFEICKQKQVHELTQTDYIPYYEDETQNSAQKEKNLKGYVNLTLKLQLKSKQDKSQGQY